MQQIFAEIGQIALCSLVSIAVMFFLTRAGGKRQIAQLSPFDYLNAVTIGSIAAEMATDLERWYRPLTALLVYGAVTWAVQVSSCKSIAMRSFWSGRTLVLMDEGTIFKENLSRANIDINEFLAQARIAGYFDLNDIQTALLENSGQISFLPKSGVRPATPADLQLHPQPVSPWYDLILDGRTMQDNLKSAGRTVSWLDAQLHAAGIGQRSEVFYAACDRGNGFFACRR